jgi:hypothetical protein
MQSNSFLQGMSQPRLPCCHAPDWLIFGYICVITILTNLFLFFLFTQDGKPAGMEIVKIEGEV